MTDVDNSRDDEGTVMIVAGPKGILRKLLTFTALDLRIPIVDEMPERYRELAART